MLLRTRLIISSVIGCILLASTMIVNEIYNQERILKTLQLDTLDSLEELWEEIILNDSEELSREAELIAKNIHIVPEFKTGNQEKIDTKLIEIVGTKFKSNPLQWIAVFNDQGSLIYFSENLKLSNNYIPSHVIKGFFKNYRVRPSGIAEDSNERQSIIGGDFVMQNNEPKFLVLSGFYIAYSVNEMAIASNNKIGLINTQGTPIYQTYHIQYENVGLESLLMKKIFELRKIGNDTYHVYSWPLYLNNKSFFGQLVLLSNGSVFHQQIKNSLYVSIFIGVLITLLITISLSFILKRAISPLEFAIHVLKALTKGDTSVKTVEYHRNDEIGSVIHATESLRKKTIEVQSLEQQSKDLIKIKEQLNIARSIQSSIVTDKPLIDKTFQVAGFMRAATEVGGDFYDYFKTKDNKLILMIGDVSGKGVPAAIFMSMTLSYLKAHLRAGLSVSESIRKTNNLLIEKNYYQFFVTVFVCSIDLRNHVMTYTNAGHNPPLLLNKKNEVKFLERTGDMALGVIQDISYKEKTLKLCPTESLFLYTDGLTEGVDIHQNQYGETRLTGFFKSGQYLPPSTHLDYIISDIDQFTGSMDQFDDMTGVILSLEPDSGIDLFLTLPMDVHQSVKILSNFVEKHRLFFEPFKEQLSHIEMVIEELVVNTIQYGADELKYKNTLISLHFQCLKKAYLTVTIKDSAKAFNPLEKEKPDLDEHLAKRKMGGLGIYLTRELSDKFDYRYENGMNIVTLTFLK